jgi:hypothetical protein
MKLFVNEAAHKAAQENQSGPMPSDAILVMENYGRDKTTFQSVNVMHKVKGFAPEHGDWFWVTYNPDGKVVESGKVKSCIDCHRSKKDFDWKWAGSRGHHQGQQEHKGHK